MIKKSLFMGFTLALMANYGPQTFSMELSSASEDYNSSAKTISTGRYIGGGVASILVGFGVGHAIQGRYKEKGWIFTVAELVTIGGYFTSVTLLVGDAIDIAETGGDIDVGAVKTKGGMALAFLAVGIGVRVWEMVDAWILPSQYKVVKESSFQIAPLISWSDMSSDWNLGFSLKYKF